MLPGRASEILQAIGKVKIAICGDFCLDAYWMLDPRGSEVSIETGLPANAVGRHTYSLGGASNIAANVAALRPAGIMAIGVVGPDLFGRELTRQLEALDVDTRWLTVQEHGFDTVTYCKHYLRGAEQPRFDFGLFNRRSAETDAIVLAGLREALQTADAVIINQQLPGSLPNESFFAGVNALLAEFAGKIVIVDSRHYSARFAGAWRKANEVELARLAGEAAAPGDVFDLAQVERYAREAGRRLGKPVFVTRGARGMLVCDGGEVHVVPGIQILKATDTVGAGDTVLSALACCLGTGVKPAEAAELANFAAAVTVQKLFQTGTASRPEILEVAADADYLYQPELAEDIRRAVYVDGSEIELCCGRDLLGKEPITHAVFDHDGTISVLRQGWERVMEPMMIRAILGDEYAAAGETLYHRALTRVRDYIERSTGIQTLLQMEALVEMVREFGIVPQERILDRFGYKTIYNDALMETVNRRVARLTRGELNRDDWTLKGAVPFLEELRRRGVTLYLASGTDHADVVREAQALGYAALFNGGIFGAVGDGTTDSKKVVIRRILGEHGLSGPQLAVFGDGPVELRECRKCSGVAIGIASDEVRRHGLNPAKRPRLLKAGAHVLAPDFSQAELLLKLLFGARRDAKP
jgi:rfaE bifunctional protein kinase chain/domain